MSLLTRFRGLIVVGLFLAPGVATAQSENPELTAARFDARRALEIAKTESNWYWQVEYPRQRRALNAAIELTEREVRANRILLREWGPFDKFATGRPLSYSIESARLCLRDAELRLDVLRHERNDLIRFHSDEARLYDWKVADARARLVALEGGEMIEVGEKP